MACAILIAALTLLIPLNEIEHGDNYADEGLADDSLVLGEEENKNTIDWNNCPIKLSYSFDEIDWIEIPLEYEGLWSPSYILGGEVLDLKNMSDDDIIYMKAEPTSGYSAVSGESTIQIENLEVAWQHTSSEDVILHYDAFVKSTNDGWTWQIPISTLGKCGDYDYPLIDFVVSGTECLCKLFKSVDYQRISFLSLDSPRSIQSDLSALVGTYVYGDQTIQIYKNGDEYVKRIVDEISKGQPVASKIGDLYYTLDENNDIKSSVPVGYSTNAYMSIYKNSDVVVSLTAIDDYTYHSANSSAEIISKGSVFERKSTGISIDEFEYPDIQTAIDCANKDDIIELDVGKYHLDNFITIDKNITLKGIIGETKETSSVITGFQGSSTANPVVNIRIESSATLDSVWIDIDPNAIGANGDNLNGMRGAIDLGDSITAKVMNCKFTKATPSEANDQSTAVYAGSGSLIENNYFSGWIKAIYSENNNNSKTTIIKNNIFESNTYGIQIALTPNYQIINNVISDSNVSISGENVEFNNNQFYNVTLKVYSSSVIILNNAFMDVFEVINKNSAGEPIDVSGNYWGGDKPTLDDSKFKFDSWYTQYDPETNTLSGLVDDDVPGVTPDVPDVPSVPDVPDVPTTPEVPTPDENGDVSVEIPKTDIDKIVDDAVSSGSSSVTITDVSDVENVSSVTISKNDLQNVLDKLESEDSISEAVVTLPEGSVSIGKDVLSSILETSGEESITIKVSDAKNELNEEQQKIVGDRPVYNVTMMSGSEKITSFDGKTITISIPYELKENEDPDNIVVYYVKDDGTIEKMNCTYKDGKVSFETDHLSYFAISYEVPEPVPEEPVASNNDNTIYYVIAAVVVLLAIIAAAYFITKRKQ